MHEVLDVDSRRGGAGAHRFRPEEARQRRGVAAKHTLARAHRCMAPARPAVAYSGPATHASCSHDGGADGDELQGQSRRNNSIGRCGANGGRSRRGWLGLRKSRSRETGRPWSFGGDGHGCARSSGADREQRRSGEASEGVRAARRLYIASVGEVAVMRTGTRATRRSALHGRHGAVHVLKSE